MLSDPHPATPQSDLDRSLAELRDKAREFARMAPAAKAALLREVLPRIVEVAPDWVAAGCRAKGIDTESPAAGEEWLAGPTITTRNARLLAESLDEVARRGRPRPGRGVRRRADGRCEVEVFPTSGMDGAMFGGFSAVVLFPEGVDERQVVEKQAPFYQTKDPEGGVSLVLGAGNVSSIPPTDTFWELFASGRVVLLKMNPVNEWVGPFLERALEPLVRRGFLRFAYGGGDVGAYLAAHAGVDHVHITGSDRTHDLIVWGPEGPDQARRKREKDPVFKKTITSELGNVSPVAIVPATFTDDELWFVARNVASMVVNNASFNCNAAKLLVLSKGWKQRDAFVGLVEKALGEVPPRRAYYPGARDRYDRLTAGRERLRAIGRAGEGELPWTIVRDVDAGRVDDPVFRVEPFCAILSETTISSSDAPGFLAEATRFLNDRVWGTLNAMIVADPRTAADPAVARAMDRAALDLRYGTVAINHWPALGYGFVSPPWGGHPSATLEDVQSGIGWVHNTFLLGGLDKTIVRGPLTVSPKPPWFYDNRRTHEIGRRLVPFEAAPSWLKVPGVALAALRG